MKALRPILRDNPNDRVRALLGSARLDVPPTDWKDRALFALACTECLAPDLDTSQMTIGSKGTGRAMVAATGPKLGSEIATATIAKWVAIGAVAGGALTATVMHAAQSQSGPRSTPTAAEPSIPPPPRDGPSAQEITAEPARSATASLTSAPGSSLSPPSRETTPRPIAAPPGAFGKPPSLGEELRSLQHIKQLSLEQGALAALKELDRHERKYPAPSLGIETMVLRIDLLWKGGQKSAAEGLGASFLHAYPDCPHAQHVRALLAANAGRDAAQAPRASTGGPR